jgi:hypothetical protein
MSHEATHIILIAISVIRETEEIKYIGTNL